MLFNSFAFAVFFPAVTILYFLLPSRARWGLLLAASCFFYCFFIPIYILILVFTIIVDYAAGILIEGHRGVARRLWLVASLVANLGTLAFFKYWNFSAINFNDLASFLHWGLRIPILAIILPIGLSFHTFQAMSYTIEVYRGNQKAERNFGIYALYVMFYPQLVAGPIERPQNLLHQFREYHSFDYDRVTAGLKRMAWGLYKKVVVADNIAPTVDLVYSAPSASSGPQVVAATILYAFQIYCDFSGYSDIAIGAAQVMGINLMTNFRQPYLSASISEFWRRWHISLSTWFRDYLYIPMGGNRVPGWRRAFNLLTVFLLCGLWHGANWNFLAWGFLHGVYLVVGMWTAAPRERLAGLVGLTRMPRFHRFIKQATTFALVCYAWIFFRAANISTALTLTGRMFSGWRAFHLSLLGLSSKSLAVLAASLAAVLVFDGLQQTCDVWERLGSLPRAWRWAIYYSVMFAIVLLGRFGSRQFIYFQF
jgi:D-alanyl-lipoteichoic acid acyltransferase DltB (MBOAT superfamily)